jgi:hypothetical protein
MVARQVVPLTPSGSSHPKTSPSRQQSAPVNPLTATPMDLPASAANKRLTQSLNPLDATLTKNRGTGVALQLSAFLRSNVQRCNSFPVTSLAAPTVQPQSNHILTRTMGRGRHLYFPDVPTCRSHPSTLRPFDPSGSCTLGLLHSFTVCAPSLPHSSSSLSAESASCR